MFWWKDKLQLKMKLWLILIRSFTVSLLFIKYLKKRDRIYVSNVPDYNEYYTDDLNYNFKAVWRQMRA